MNAQELQAKINEIIAKIKATPDEDEDALWLLWSQWKRLEKQLEAIKNET